MPSEPGTPRVLALILPTAGTTAADAANTVAAIDADAGVPVVIVAGEHWSDGGAEGASPMLPEQILASADVLAFARPGDRWRPGAFAARLRTFAAHPSAGLSVAGHAIVAQDGSETLTVAAPGVKRGPLDLLIAPRTEASAVLARSSVLDAGALELAQRPHGDGVVWNRIAQEHGLMTSGEIAADVPLDPRRHGHAPDVVMSELATALTSAGWVDGPAGARLRREFLRRRYLEPSVDGQPELDLAALLPAADERARDLIEDLTWALERLHEALEAERVAWPGWPVDPRTPRTLDYTEGTLDNLYLDVGWLHAEVALRDAAVRRLEAEVTLRDAQERI
jgi:hypothetical protein